MARSVIRAGATTQFAKTFRIIGLGLLAGFLRSPNAMPRTVGYLMKKSQKSMGINILANLRESRYSPKPGANLPRRSGG